MNRPEPESRLTAETQRGTRGMSRKGIQHKGTKAQRSERSEGKGMHDVLRKTLTRSLIFPFLPPTPTPTPTHLTKAQRSEGKGMRGKSLSKDRELRNPFCLALPLSLALSYPYSNSSRRDFTAETQRGTRGMRKKERGLNTKAEGRGKCSVFSVLCSDRKRERREDLPWAENRDWQRLRCLYLLSVLGRGAGNG